MLEVKNLRFAYEARVFCYNLSVASGECVALLGTSGAGKTSLLNLLAGFETALDGEAHFNGENLLALPPHKRPVSMIFQDHNLFPHLSVGDNVGLGLPKEAQKNKQAAREHIAWSLQQVGLKDFATRMPVALSGGERRRVALARALVRDKPLLLLDEAFTALHPALRYDMLDLLDDLRKRRGLTVLLVTHLPDEAERISDKTAFIEDGEILTVGETKQMLSAPPIDALAQYLGKA